MASPPQRRDYNTVVRDLEIRIDRLERSTRQALDPVTGGDKNLRFPTSGFWIASSTITVLHGLGKLASVQVYGTDDQELDVRIRQDSTSQVTVFSDAGAFQGYAVCN